VLDVDVARKAFRGRRDAAGRTSQPVLEAVRFSAAEGEVLALFGASGVGKTTLLRLVLGLDTDFDGRIECPPGPPGVMFQEPRLVPWLSVAGNLRLVAPHAGAEAIAGVLRGMGLAGTERLRPGELSLGMARRVALARALVTAPRWLVLDEPFASLDPGNTAMLANTVAAYADRTPATVLLATHELDLALAIADRVLVIAGAPSATLALDLPVRARPEAALRRELLARFPFLGGGVASPEPTMTGD
jgi:NitT/TauT family transport system ATP-binding protein